MGLENILTIVGEHVNDATTGEIQKRELEEKEDPSILIEPNQIYFRDATMVAVTYKGKTLGAFKILGNTALDSKHDKITANLVLGKPAIKSHVFLEAESLQGGGGGFNVGKILGTINVPHKIEYIGLHPKGSPIPEIPKGVESRIIEVESNECPYLLNLVIPKVIDEKGKTIVSDRMIIRHPRATDIDFNGEIDIKPGVVLLDSIAYPNLLESVVKKMFENNAEGKNTIGVAALTGKMVGDIAYKLMKYGFTTIMNETEVCKLATNIFDYYSLKPFDEVGIDYSSLLLGVEALQGIRGKTVQSPIFLTLGDQGSMCIDTSGKIYLAGIMKPEVPTVNTNGAGDAYAAGLVEAIFRDNFAEKRQLGIEGIMRFATAMARAKLDNKINREYLNELVSGTFAFDMLPNPIGFYTEKIKTSRQGGNLVNEQIREEVSNRNMEYYLPSPIAIN